MKPIDSQIIVRAIVLLAVRVHTPELRPEVHAFTKRLQHSAERKASKRSIWRIHSKGFNTFGVLGIIFLVDLAIYRL